ncbi:MAG: HAD hydrolase-like protein [Verrucomicrobiota bacterium]
MPIAPKPVPSCLVFDFDGTIADTLSEALRLFNRLAPVYGYKQLPPNELEKARNMTTKQFIRAYDIPRMKIPSMIREGRRIFGKRISEIKPIEGMPDVLRTLRPKVTTLGILTSNAKVNVEAFLTKEDLQIFDFISTVPKLGGKAKNLRSVMKTFTLDPSTMAYVGDETRDVRAAQKALVRSVGVTWGFNRYEAIAKEKPYDICENPIDLLKLVGQIED